MSVENLRVDEPASKGWANLYMNNLTVYDTITAKNYKRGDADLDFNIPGVGVVTQEIYPGVMYIPCLVNQVY